MNNKLTIGGVVLLHAVAILLLTTVGGCRTSGSMDRNNDTGAYSGFPREANGSGYVATASAKSAAPAARPVTPEAVPAEAVTAEPVPTPVKAEPTAEAAVKAKPVSEPKPVGTGRTHVVKANESLWVIAKREGVSTTALAEANGLKKNAILREGQKLVIPAAGVAKSPSSGAPVAGKSASAAVSSETYVVKKGDVLSIVARKLGTTSAALRAENNIKGDAIREGQKLRIPSGATKKAAVDASVKKGAPAAAPAPGKDSAASVAPVTGSGESAPGLKPLVRMGGAAPSAAPVSSSPVAAPAPVAEPVEAVDVAK